MWTNKFFPFLYKKICVQERDSDTIVHKDKEVLNVNVLRTKLHQTYKMNT